ncbi:MAG: hypothetical protein K9L78_04005 [Victivallales bacterium]|nr:hypothetical protein [Victivallales bacterium]MCF7889265.1 hypothetical protein [Victivallales bacterium]
MVKKKKGFIDKNLLGLKNRIQTREETLNENENESDKLDNKPEAESFTKGQDKNKIEHVSTLNKYDENIAGSFLKKNTKSLEEQAGLDKQYMKILQKRKEEYIRTKKHVIEKSNFILNNASDLMTELNRELNVLQECEKKLKETLNDIEKIEEKGWKDRDYSAELGDAVKTVENARLQNLLFTDKIKRLEREKCEETAKTESSIIPELISLKFTQLFKLGIGLLMPVIIGSVLCGVIISITIFFVMGGF